MILRRQSGGKPFGFWKSLLFRWSRNGSAAFGVTEEVSRQRGQAIGILDVRDISLVSETNARLASHETKRFHGSGDKPFGFRKSLLCVIGF